MSILFCKHKNMFPPVNSDQFAAHLTQPPRFEGQLLKNPARGGRSSQRAPERESDGALLCPAAERDYTVQFSSALREGELRAGLVHGPASSAI